MKGRLRLRPEVGIKQHAQPFRRILQPQSHASDFRPVLYLCKIQHEATIKRNIYSYSVPDILSSEV